MARVAPTRNTKGLQNRKSSVDRRLAFVFRDLAISLCGTHFKSEKIEHLQHDSNMNELSGKALTAEYVCIII